MRMIVVKFVQHVACVKLSHPGGFNTETDCAITLPCILPHSTLRKICVTNSALF
jgi:hypothetical protein